MLIEQVEQLAQSNQVNEAITTLEKLFEQSDGNLIEADAIQRAGTLATQRYVPVRKWVNDRLAQLLIQHPEARENYLKNHEAAAQAALADAANSKDLARTRQAAQRFALSTSGHPLQLLLADLYLEMGWGYAATQIVNQQLPCMRYPLKPTLPAGSTGNSLLSN